MLRYQMYTLKLLIVLFLLICVFIAPLQAAPKPLLPNIDLEFVIAGLAHTEVELKSGTGNLKYFAADNFNKKLQRANTKRKTTHSEHLIIDEELIEDGTVSELWFAFDEEGHSYFKYFLDDDRIAHVLFDGRIHLFPGKPHAFGYGTPEDHIYDPRNWGIAHKGLRWSDYLLQQEAVHIIGSEAVDGIACYIVEAPYPGGYYDTMKLWIAPKGGFRLIQVIGESNDRKLSVKIDWQQYQLQTGVVWFPKDTELLAWEEGEVFKNEIKVTNFQPNIDVSAYFDLQISPETEIYHMDLRKLIPFKEIGWRTLEPTSK